MGSTGSTQWMGSRADRAELRPCCICDDADGECRDGFVHAGRRWEIGITWPGNSFASPVVLLDGVCAATVEDRYEPVGDDDYELRYRGACCGCGWASAHEHDDSNAAQEDGLDHALPDWSRVPVLARLGHDAPAAQVQRRLVEVGDLYRALGLDER